MLRDILKGDDQADAVAEVIARVAPDVLVLNGIDYDHGNLTLTALEALVAQRGHRMPFLFAARPNSGRATGLDLDGDGRLGGPGDSQGWGRYAGDGGMAVLSRFRIGAARDLSGLLWAGQDWALLPREEGKLVPSEAAYEAQRLSSVGHWVVPVEIGGRNLSVMAFHATPPVFDGPEDRNGKRNHDEIVLWRHLLDGAYGGVPDGPFVIAGDANLDPLDGEGIKVAITGLLSDKRLQDPAPRSAGAGAAADADHRGDPALDTVDWPRAEAGGPGNLRVDYVLPSAGLEVMGAGVWWPAPGESDQEIATRASRHRLVWVDIRW
ncbi:endonuclease/exonuclease/phosphatase family protein [Marimonas arenosa]|uniref:Endonuclease/exonuclease/phosphatase family protein n=1 Tax=Marimonas arenosa TaxID=1795305 RepID=A0AAE4B662_9RHOB|nr:endonuclease/exonuclease/phosphatase family protein [Marimonas arenosa]MDQ2090021.1 endonuclease/exonuclease/phosphatase family protein [Marimonas arenosa]